MNAARAEVLLIGEDGREVAYPGYARRSESDAWVKGDDVVGDALVLDFPEARAGSCKVARYVVRLGDRTLHEEDVRPLMLVTTGVTPRLFWRGFDPFRRDDA